MKLINKQNPGVVIYAPYFRKIRDKYYHPILGLLKADEWWLRDDNEDEI